MKPTKRSKKPAPRAPESRRVILTLELETTYTTEELEDLARCAFTSELLPSRLEQFQANTIRARA
jgi:hypothetical protein